MYKLLVLLFILSFSGSLLAQEVTYKCYKSGTNKIKWKVKKIKNSSGISEGWDGDDCYNASSKSSAKSICKEKNKAIKNSVKYVCDTATFKVIKVKSDHDCGTCTTPKSKKDAKKECRKEKKNNKKKKYYYCKAVEGRKGKVKSVKAKSLESAQKDLPGVTLYSKTDRKKAKQEPACQSGGKFYVCLPREGKKGKATKVKGVRTKADVEKKHPGLTIYESKNDAKGDVACLKGKSCYYCVVENGKVKTRKVPVTAGVDCNGKTPVPVTAECDVNNGKCADSSSVKMLWAKKKQAKRDPVCKPIGDPKTFYTCDPKNPTVAKEIKAENKKAAKALAGDFKVYKSSKRALKDKACKSKDFFYCIVNEKGIREIITVNKGSKKLAKTQYTAETSKVKGKLFRKEAKAEKDKRCNPTTTTALLCSYCLPSTSNANGYTIEDIDVAKLKPKYAAKLNKKNKTCKDIPRGKLKKLIGKDIYKPLERKMKSNKGKYKGFFSIFKKKSKYPLWSTDKTTEAQAFAIAEGVCITADEDKVLCAQSESPETFKIPSQQKAYNDKLASEKIKAKECTVKGQTYDTAICSCKNTGCPAISELLEKSKCPSQEDFPGSSASELTQKLLTHRTKWKQCYEDFQSANSKFNFKIEESANFANLKGVLNAHLRFTDSKGDECAKKEYEGTYSIGKGTFSYLPGEIIPGTFNDLDPIYEPCLDKLRSKYNSKMSAEIFSGKKMKSNKANIDKSKNGMLKLVIKDGKCVSADILNVYPSDGYTGLPSSNSEGFEGSGNGSGN